MKIALRHREQARRVYDGAVFEAKKDIPVGIALASLLICCVAASACQAQTRPVLCSRGDGNFEAEFRTGVGLRVEAARNGELATRVCEATLNWDGQQLVIAAGAAQLDVDAFGVNLDLGVGAPVAALQVKKSDAECCMAYRIYSLLKPPRLLRTITGGDFFSAADTDLDGRVEIWTDDAAAVDGFEHLELSSLDAAPTMVLRFAHGQLLDVSSEFQPDFDRQVEKLRAELDPQDLRDFKSSDGRLAPTASFSLEALHRRDRLQAAKIKVLEIVWSYLYSGREQEAWHSLTDLWPAADVDRIRAAILTARARGIRAQVNGASAGVPTGGRTQASIYDALIVEAGKPELVPPQPILLRRPPPLGASEQGLAAAEVRLALVVDSAGKVRSAQPVDSAEWVDTGLKAATANWKFIPAFKDGRAVASRIGFVVSLKR